MKKITFIFVGVVYFVAIVLVAFLGVQAEFQNSTVEVTSIMLKEAEKLGKDEYLTYPANVDPTNSIYTLYTRPQEERISPIDGMSGNIVWNLQGTKLDYVIQIRDFKYIYESPEWRYGPTHFDLASYVIPENATEQQVRYTITGTNGETPTYVSVDENGMMTFQEKLTAIVTTFIVNISSTDNSGVVCNVRFMVLGYKD